MNARTARLLRRAAAKAARNPNARLAGCKVPGYQALKARWRAYTRAERTASRIDLAHFIASSTRRIP